MSLKDCVQLAKSLDPEDAAALMAQQKDLVASGVPGGDAWTQAAELVMESVLEERNALAGEIAAKGGYLGTLDIENLLNPQSYPQPDTGVAMRQQAPGANQRKGTLSTLKQEYPVVHEAVQRMLRRMPKKDAAMVRRNLKEHEGTGWAASAVKSLTIRDVFEGLMTGRDVDAVMNDEFWGKDPLSRYTMINWLKKGPKGAEYLAESYAYIGTNRKAENDVSGSFLNCEPSKACAQHCYAVAANGRTVELMKAEFTELASRMFPEVVANKIAQDYKHSKAGMAGLSLRINDKGDLSDAQVDVIKRLNEKGTPLQVFSKRPELLRKLSDVNLKMLSIDETNFDVALENKDLNLAVTLTDGFTEDMVQQVNDRVSVYLPVNLRGKAWDTRTLKALFPKTFRDMANKLCPVEAGKVTTRKGVSFVDIPAGMADGNWTCTACDLLGAVGCFHKDRKTSNRKAAMGLFEITVNEAQNEANHALTDIQKALHTLQKAGAIDARSVESTLAELRDAVRVPQQGNQPDPEATGTEIRGERGGPDTGEPEENGSAARRATTEVAPAQDKKEETKLDESGKYEIPEESVSPKDGNTVRESEGGEGDLLSAPGVSGEEARTQSADTFHVLYEPVEAGTVRSGVTQIKSHDDAAHLFAHIRKMAQETFLVAVTDDAGNILNLIRHSIGTRDGASVYPIDVVGAIAATEGGTKYWLAHNHPSGVREPSQADKRITEIIEEHTIGLGVQYQGHVVIGDTGYSDVFGGIMDKPIPAYARRNKIAITERRLKRRANSQMRVIASPNDSLEVIAGLQTKTGLLLLDNRNKLAGVVALTEAEMSKLRDGKQVRRILNAIDKTNATAAIGFNKKPGPNMHGALENLANYLANIKDLRTLDLVFKNEATNSLLAYSGSGWAVGDKDKGFTLRRGAEKTNQDKSAHRKQVDRWLKKPLKRLQNRVPIIIMNDVDEVDFDVPPKTAGFKKDGKVYLFRDNLRDEEEAVMAITHEAIGHLGIEGALGKRKFEELLGDVMNLMVEIMIDPKAHPKIQEIQAELRKYYIDENGEYQLDARTEAREILAHIAHSKPRLGRLREIYNKIVAWIGEWAASMGIGDPDMARIESLLVRATDYVLDPDRAVTEDFEKGAAMRRQQPDNNWSPEEEELAGKLGLGKKETKSLLQKISSIRDMDIKGLTKAATARGYEGLFDGLIEIKRKEQEAGVGLGREIAYLTPDGVRKTTRDYEGSAYVAARLATGISDMMTHLLNFGSLQWDGGIVAGVEGTRGFLDVMKDLGEKNLNNWLIWMGANRAEQLRSEGREFNLTPEQIALGKTMNRGNEELFTRIKEEYNEMNRHQLDFAQEAGLIDAEKRAEWESEWYVPFYRQTDEDRTLGPSTTRGLSHQSAGIRRLMGAKVPTADLMENILTNWIKLTDASVKNHALRTMVDNFQGTGYISNETMKFRKAMVPKNELHKFIKENRDFAQSLAAWLNLDPKTTADGIWDAISDMDSSGLEKLWQVVAPTDPDVVRVQRGGKNEYYKVHVPGLLRATGHMQPQGSQSRGMRAARWFKTLLTMGVTVSPDFMMRNFIRDAAHSWAINKDNMFFLKDSMKGLKGAVTENPIHRAMMAAGASFQGGYVHGTDPEATAKIMRRELIKSGWSEGKITQFLGSIVDTPGKLAKLAGWGWQHYRDTGDKIENASRVATADAARKAGKPMAQWLFESKDLMDYSRRGNFEALIFLTDVMPFLNARIQGLDKLGRAAASDPKIVAKRVGMIAMFSVFLAMLNDDDDEYQQLPDWEKDAYWHVFTTGASGEKEHFRIPKPFEIGFLFGTMPERMYRSWYTKSQPSEKVLWAFQHGIRETLNINLYPQIILPIAELKANRHFYFDQPIESLADQNVIPSERYNQYTSETAVLLAQGLDNPLTDWIGVSPKQLQHLWNGYTGTMGAYLLAGVDMLGTNPLGGFPKPEEIQLEDMPLVKSLYKGQRKRTTQWQVDVYDRIKEVNELYGTLKKYREEAVRKGDKTKYEAFKTKHYEKLRVRRVLARAQKNFSLLRKRREQILKNDELTGAEKYQQSQAIQVRINALAKKIEAATRAGF